MKLTHHEAVKAVTGLDWETFDLVMMGLYELQKIFDGDLVRKYNEIRRNSRFGKDCRYSAIAGRLFVKGGEFGRVMEIMDVIGKLVEKARSEEVEGEAQGGEEGEAAGFHEREHVAVSLSGGSEVGQVQEGKEASTSGV